MFSTMYRNSSLIPDSKAANANTNHPSTFSTIGEIAGHEADIEASAAATRRAVSGITFGKASVAHQEMRATELTGQKEALNNRLKALESLRANLERALQPPSRGRKCSKITVETTFPVVALQEALDAGLQQRVMGVLLTSHPKP